MNTSEVPQFNKFGFDNSKYIQLQSEAILERIEKFPKGRLYLEIGGKLISDPHASRVLPGFESDNKVQIIKNIGLDFEILFCIDYEDILQNRQLSNRSTDYVLESLKIVNGLKETFGIKPKVVINKIKDDRDPLLLDAIDVLRVNGYDVYHRYYIDGYPENTEKILSDRGYGRDNYIPLTAPLVIVTGSASNSGKMSTCLGQMYMDNSRHGINSGYAKYETFPIWNLELKHPVNLAYEAATADIGDRNVLDTYHIRAYGQKSVNYNRDVQAFSIIKRLTEGFLPKDNFVTSYQSPTDMGINMAGFAITDDEVVAIAGLEEIRRRKDWYQELVDNSTGQGSWIKACEGLEREAMKFIKDLGYDSNLTLE